MPVADSCYVGGLQSLELLLSRGANPHPDGSQHTCVQLAKAQGHTKVAQYAAALRWNGAKYVPMGQWDQQDKLEE